MASDNKFTHISVNAGDDDVVIHAGAVAAESNERDAASGDALLDAVEEESFEAIPQSSEDEVVEAEAPHPASKSVYHETTLEDIQGSTMGTTQKVVIALAIVLVIAVIIWMAFFKG